MAAPIARRRVDGVLLLDKPAGLTSNAALQRAKRLYRAEKAGHTGTLDPLASGLLPLCFGDATKFAQCAARCAQGVRRDAPASVLRPTPAMRRVKRSPPAATTFRVRSSTRPFRAFVGRIQQVPPRHSALKHEGRAYYDYARAGLDDPARGA